MFRLYIYIHEQFSLFDTSANVLTGFMIFLFLAASVPRVQKSMTPNGNVSTEWAKVRSFAREKVFFYAEAKSSY